MSKTRQHTDEFYQFYFKLSQNLLLNIFPSRKVVLEKFVALKHKNGLVYEA